MEAVIDGLLKQFETGKIGRRELIKSLAAAAFVPALQAEKTAAPWKTVALDHISYAVADYKKSAAFYSSLMGWEIREDDGKGQATLGIGNIGEIIIRTRRDPAGASPSRPDRPPVTGVINHISFGIEPWDTEGVKKELERRALTPRPDMVGSDFKSYHVLDPDGWDLQISNQTGKK
jgi:catechol 2,3-dioxygenase-like lactoylglutathione lyase family enzyme